MYAGGSSNEPRTRQDWEICSACRLEYEMKQKLVQLLKDPKLSLWQIKLVEGDCWREEADPERERRGKPVVKTTHLVGGRQARRCRHTSRHRLVWYDNAGCWRVGRQDGPRQGQHPHSQGINLSTLWWHWHFEWYGFLRRVRQGLLTLGFINPEGQEKNPKRVEAC